MENKRTIDVKRIDNTQRGSAIIETVLCLTIFIIAIFTILSFINLCRAQAIVSTAVDATAKEMSEYAYLYHKSGLDGLAKRWADSVPKEDKDRLNALTGGVEAVYSSLGDIDMVSEDTVNKAIDIAMEGNIESAFDSVLDAGGIGTAAEKIKIVEAEVQKIDDPIAFMKSVVSIAGMDATTMLKSQLIAAPLSKALVKKHFSVNGMDADTYLRSLGIDGMDALNFNMSTIFTPTAPDEIHLVVYYRIEAVKFMNFEFGEIALCKESITRAWLGGDKTPETKKDIKTSRDPGVWDMGSVSYGKYIDRSETDDYIAKGGYEAATTGVDIFDPSDNTWIIVKSMDIYSDSYMDPKVVKGKLRAAYSDIASVAGTSTEKITVKERKNVEGEIKIDKVDLESPKADRKTKVVLVVPEGEETESFKAAYEEFLAEIDDPGFSVELKHGYGSSPKDVEGTE